MVLMMIDDIMCNKSSEKNVLVAMSGGVDSSVAALILCNKGFECLGVTMNICRKDADKENVSKRHYGCKTGVRAPWNEAYITGFT